MRSKQKKTPKRPQLVRKEWTEIDPATGAEVVVQTLQRGALSTKTRKIPLRSLQDIVIPTPRTRFDRLRDQLRDDLESRGLPSDRIPYWLWRDGAWVPFDLPPGEYTTPTMPPIAYWKARFAALTEPLTYEQETGELLEQLDELLRRQDIEQHLYRIFRVMKAYANYSIAGSVNDRVDQADRAAHARSQGPNARRERAVGVAQVIAKHVEKLWEKDPRLLGDASNSAGHIQAVVNQELASQCLLPSNKKALSQKTIADYIRKLAEQILRH